MGALVPGGGPARVQVHIVMKENRECVEVKEQGIRSVAFYTESFQILKATWHFLSHGPFEKGLVNDSEGKGKF